MDVGQPGEANEAEGRAGLRLPGVLDCISISLLQNGVFKILLSDDL